MQLGFFDALTNLVEDVVNRNDGQPAVIVGHSMGCLVTQFFLTHHLPVWRAKYVAAFVSVSAPYLGSVTALKGKLLLLCLTGE